MVQRHYERENNFFFQKQMLYRRGHLWKLKVSYIWRKLWKEPRLWVLLNLRMGRRARFLHVVRLFIICLFASINGSIRVYLLGTCNDERLERISLQGGFMFVGNEIMRFFFIMMNNKSNAFSTSQKGNIKFNLRI